jgi:hypothetical protein
MKLWMMMALLCASLFSGSLLAAQDDSLTVDASASLGTISPYVYGSNMGLYSIIPPALMDEATALNLGYMRFGGGESDRQDIRTTSIDLFVFQTRQIGAEPALTVRLLGGTPERAADIVRYTNIEKGYNVRYWSIGNEPNLFVTLMGIDRYTTEDLNREWRAIAEAMLEVDPNIILVGPDITQYIVTDYEDGTITYMDSTLGGSPVDAEGRDWMVEFLKANGDLVDIISIHRYPYPGAGQSAIATATIDGLRENVHQWDPMIANLREIIRDTTGRDIPIAVTEFNSNSSPSSGAEASLDSLYNAIWAADVLGRLINQQVEIAAIWDMQGIGARNWGLLTQTGVRPVYYTYLLYTHFGTELVDAQSSDRDVSIYGALTEDGALTLVVVNLGPENVTKTLDISGFTPSGDAEVWRLDAEHNAEQINSEPVTDGGTITLPGQSVTLYRIPGNN